MEAAVSVLYRTEYEVVTAVRTVLLLSAALRGAVSEYSAAGNCGAQLLIGAVSGVGCTV